jgi:rare lipoprotein A
MELRIAARAREPDRESTVYCGTDRGGEGSVAAPFSPYSDCTERLLETADETASSVLKGEGMQKGRIVLFATSILTCQLLPTHVARVFAADQIGAASIYSHESGSRTASGQKINPGAFTAAHRSLPFGSKVKVTNTRNGRSVVVTINDRGPFVRGRIIDVTPAAARELGFSGVAQVTLNRSD